MHRTVSVLLLLAATAGVLGADGPPRMETPSSLIAGEHL